MKVAFALLSMYATLAAASATPTKVNSHATTYDAPEVSQPQDVNEFVEAVAPPLFEEAAAATQYWICEAVSPSTRAYGWSQGGSESAALSAAKKKCGKSDCNAYSCVNEGCVGLDFGSTTYSLSYATGYGSSDGTEAASKALAACKSKDTGCAKAGYFCSQYIL